jgi:hypothetical protein
MTNKVEQVRELLIKFSKIDKNKIPKKKDNKKVIDTDKLMEVPEVKELIGNLKKLGVEGDWLLDNGFIPAHITLAHLL